MIGTRRIGAFSSAIRILAVMFGAVFLIGGITIASPKTTAKTPGKNYCFLGVCHRVLTLAQTRREVGRHRTAVASYYRSCHKDRYNPCGLTSSGAVFRPDRPDNAASPIYPNGTRLLVWNPRNKRSLEVRIDNAGPYWGRRTLDLSHAAARKLGFARRGVARLKVLVLSAPTQRQARYRRHRRYSPVRGYIGRFASLEQAYQAVRGRRAIGRVYAQAVPPVPALRPALATLERAVLRTAVARATVAPRRIRLASLVRAPNKRVSRGSVKAPSRAAKQTRTRKRRKFAGPSRKQKGKQTRQNRKTPPKAVAGVKSKLASANAPGKGSVGRPAAKVAAGKIPVAAPVKAQPKRRLAWKRRIFGVNGRGS